MVGLKPCAMVRVPPIGEATEYPPEKRYTFPRGKVYLFPIEKVYFSSGVAKKGLSAAETPGLASVTYTGYHGR